MRPRDVRQGAQTIGSLRAGIVVAVDARNLVARRADPTLYLNPSTDGVFHGVVDAARRESATPNQLQSRLRRTYPRAVVRARGLEGEFPERWYVYREGRWVS